MFCQMWIPVVWQADPHVLEIQFNCFSTTRVLLATVALAFCYLRVDDSDLISMLCRSCGSSCFYLTNLAAYLICNFYGAMTRNIHMFLWTTTNFIYLYCVMLSFLVNSMSWSGLGWSNRRLARPMVRSGSTWVMLFRGICPATWKQQLYFKASLYISLFRFPRLSPWFLLLQN